MDDADRRLDGNAAAGMFAAALGIDVTVDMTLCRACGAQNLVGALMAYIHGMGAVLRCPQCDGMILRITQTPGRYWLDLSGLRTIRIEDVPP